MPENTIQIRKGRNLPLQGKPQNRVTHAAEADTYAVLPFEFPYVKPKLLIAEGDLVEIGTPLFHDKLLPEMKFLSPAGGEIAAIERGERRSLERIVIKRGTKETSAPFETWTDERMETIERKDAIAQLLAGGLWPALRQRPYNCAADPGIVPRSIFVNGMNTEPLAADVTLVMLNQKNNFRAGMKVLRCLTAGSVYLSIAQGASGNIDAYHDNPGVKVFEFAGPHPAGTHSVQIFHLERLRKGEIVWTIDAYQVALIGRLFLEGVYPVERVIAAGGSGVKEPQHYLTRLGASIETLLGNNVHDGSMRFIMGSVLTGTKTPRSGYISFMKPDITVIPEGKKRDFLGWLTPGTGALSFSRAFLSAFSPGKSRSVNTNLHGSLRAIVATDVYDRYLPLDIHAVALIKSVIGQDTEKAEKLGILECVAEDFALASFMCPSKIDLCQIIDRGLRAIKKENE